MRIRLSESQRLWLRSLCSKLRTGEQVSARDLKVELRDKLAEDFDPSKIDTRLLADEDQITLLGITLFDPTNELVKKADLVIRSIHDLLIRSPKTKNVSAEFISQETNLPKQEVAVIFKRLSRLAYFHDYGTKYGYGIDGLLTIDIDERTFDAYLKYTSLKGLLDSLTDDEGDLVNRATEERVQEVLQHIRNLQSGLTNIWVKAIDEQDLNGAIEDLQRWKVQATQFLRDHISEVEARELQRITQKFPLIRHVGDLDFRISKYEERLKGLAKEIQDDPTLLLISSRERPEAVKPQRHENSLDAPGQDPTRANQLYDKVKNLIQNPQTLNEANARLVVESVDDAIKEFGSTNQEKKVELRKWKAKAELVLPPSTIEELRRRAEGELLKKSYPQNARLRQGLLAVVALAVIAGGLLALKPVLSGSREANGGTSLPISTPTPALSGFDYWTREKTDEKGLTPRVWRHWFKTLPECLAAEAEEKKEEVTAKYLLNPYRCTEPNPPLAELQNQCVNDGNDIACQVWNSLKADNRK